MQISVYSFTLESVNYMDMCVCVGASQYFLIQSELAESLTQDGKFCVFSSYSSAKFSCSHSCSKASIKHH